MGKNAIEYYGRFLKIGDEMQFDWSGSTVEAGFRGTGISMALRLVAGTTDYFNVYVDGGEPTVLMLSADKTVYTLAENLPMGDHVIRVEKRTEGCQGALCAFGGFTVEGGELTAAPARKARTLEVVGDSITAAYGNMAPVGGWSGFKPEEENFGLSYGKRTADALNADVTVLGWSGEGMFQDLGGNRATVFSNSIYRRTLAHFDKQDFVPTFEPDVMVINLGTNDFQANVVTPKDDFVEGYETAYAQFLREVREQYKHAHIVMCIGPINFYAYDSLCKVKAVRAAEGDENLSVLKMEFVKTPEDKRWGADGHPSAQGHAEMAEMLTAHIRGVKNW